MQIDRRRVYFNAVLGGIGGLLGWVLVAQLASGAASSAGGGIGRYLAVAWRGMLIGVAIGAGVGAADGIVANRSWRRAGRGAGYGAALGAAGGLVGIVLGELIFGVLGGGLWPKAIGWAVFGALVGSCDGIAQRMPSKVRYGVVGGLLGGLIGGSTYERVTRVLIGLSGDRAFALALGGAIGLILLGACIGALMGLVESLLRRAWLTFLGGRSEGQTRTLDPEQPRTTLGRSDGCAIVLRDAGVSDLHAEITASNGSFAVAPCGGKITVQGGPPLSGPHPLREGDEVVVGGARFVFHTSEGNAS